MSPVSSPDAAGQSEEIRDAVEAAVDLALASTRAGQREIEARLTRLELAIRDLQLADQARAATFAGSIAAAPPPLAPMRAHQPTLPMGAGDPVRPPVAPVVQPVAPLAPAAPVVPLAAPLVAQAPAAPVAVRAPAPIAPVPTYTLPPRSLDFDDEPFDVSMLPGGLDGGRRKRRIIAFALVLAVLGLGGLIALAVASQAVHGL
jgi:hypothetical protein